MGYVSVAFLNMSNFFVIYAKCVLADLMIDRRS